MRSWIHLVLIAVAVVVSAAFYRQWRSARQDTARLQAQLDEAKQTLQRTNVSQQQRDKQLTTTLAQLNSLKSTVNSQQKILARLPDVLPLPKPLTAADKPLDSRVQSAIEESNRIKPDLPQPQTTAVPPEDLKPLYDFAVDCNACQAKLAAATGDLADEKSKTQALSRERDAAVQAARGGSFRQQLKRSAKWFFIGVLAGVAAAKAR